MGSDFSTYTKEFKKSSDADVCEDHQKAWKRPWKEWEKGNKDTERYVVTKRKTRKAVYQEKCELERYRFINVSLQDDHKYEVFKIATGWPKLTKILLVNSA